MYWSVRGFQLVKMAYCAANDVRLLCGLSDDDIDDAYLTELISRATARLNADMSNRVVLENVDYIDEYRENKINGSNTEFYTQNSFTYAMGDLNDDGDLTIDDVDVYYYDPVNNTRTAATVSAVTSDGKVTMATAPDSNYEVKITYRYQPLSISPVNPLVEDACTYLAGAYAYMKISPSDFDTVAIGRLRYKKKGGGVGRGGFDSTAGKFMEAYMDIVRKIDYIGTVLVEPGVTYLTIDFEEIGVI